MARFWTTADLTSIANLPQNLNAQRGNIGVASINNAGRRRSSDVAYQIRKHLSIHKTKHAMQA